MKKAAAESLEEYLEREGTESVLGLSMKEFVNRFCIRYTDSRRCF